MKQMEQTDTEQVEEQVTVKYHVLERYCERVLKIPKSDISAYITQNRDRLTADVLKIFKFSKFIYKGQLGKDNITMNYYIQGEIILVVTTDNKTMITMYKVDLGYPKELNTQVRKGLTQEIYKLRDEKDDLETKALTEHESLQEKSLAIDNQMALLKAQMDELRVQKDAINAQIKATYSRTTYIDKDIQRYVMMLINSLDYKRDIDMQLAGTL